jgi:hypothetical protein
MKTKFNDGEAVLFLDIDGVLCTDRAYLAYGQDKTKSILRTYDPLGIMLVDRLCQDYNLKVVISSTWRHRNDVPLILLSHGFKSDFHEDEKTPSRLRGSNRGDEIGLWLEDHPTVNNFLILDDDTDGMKGTQFEDFQTVTDYYDGILFKNYKEAVKILEKQLSGELIYTRRAD